MRYDPLRGDDYVPQISGHQTFPLRYGWLKKALDRVERLGGEPDSIRRCWGEDAIADLGVGKNMVGSIRYWSKAARIIEEREDRGVYPTSFGHKFFSDDGLDPWMENPSTSWVIHWHLASNPRLTTWFWVFNYHAEPLFSRDDPVHGLARIAHEQRWKKASYTTLQKDVACLFLTYTRERARGEDALQSPLAELGLLRSAGARDLYHLDRGDKPTLGDGVFNYAIHEFWQAHHEGSSTLSLENITYLPGSPGRVFALDEDAVAERLLRFEDETVTFEWQETAGMRQIVKKQEYNYKDNAVYLAKDYSNRAKKK